MPPLRGRKEDNSLLISFFVQKLAKQMQKQVESVPTTVMEGLTGGEWPGNTRELENFVERAVIQWATSSLFVLITPEVVGSSV